MADKKIFEVTGSSFDSTIELTIFGDNRGTFYFNTDLTRDEAKQLRKLLKEALDYDKP